MLFPQKLNIQLHIELPLLSSRQNSFHVMTSTIQFPIKCLSCDDFLDLSLISDSFVDVITTLNNLIASLKEVFENKMEFEYSLCNYVEIKIFF